MSRSSRPNALSRLALPGSAFAVSGLLALGLLVSPTPAHACGCLSPPVPPPGVEEFAVNQQAEQIIFEKPDMNTVRAHVLIRYNGNPESFAWLVPVPSAPELALSEDLLFGYLEDATRPRPFSLDESICPHPEYYCKYRHEPDCSPPDAGGQDSWGYADTSTTFDAFAADTTSGNNPPPGIDVIGSQIVGEYETVTFRADESHLAVQWLNDNGFIVNDSMAPYMQPYVDEGMVFVAAKLVPGAGIDAIRPLSITYEGQHPMIPLRLTAVAAEPHLTVTAWFFGDAPYAPIDHPLITVPTDELGRDDDDRINYPMVLSRIIDEAGGDAYVLEDRGETDSLFRGLLDDPSGCCDPEVDVCSVAGDGQCQCPGTSYDGPDCSEIDGLSESIDILEDIATRHRQYTRLTTRLSPHEMTFDPSFDLRAQEIPSVPSLVMSQLRLTDCENDIIDTELYEAITALDACTSVYCGAGECTVDESGRGGCECDDGFTARIFTDLDGQPSVTCIEETNTVDFGQNVDVPDACADVDCGAGTCVDVGGFATCACYDGATAVIEGDGEVPTCVTSVYTSEGRGARDYTDALRNVAVCAPAPPICGEDGWLVAYDDVEIRGEACPSSIPDPADLEPLPDYCRAKSSAWRRARSSATKRSRPGSSARKALAKTTDAAVALRRPPRASAAHAGHGSLPSVRSGCCCGDGAPRQHTDPERTTGPPPAHRWLSAAFPRAPHTPRGVQESALFAWTSLHHDGCPASSSPVCRRSLTPPNHPSEAPMSMFRLESPLWAAITALTTAIAAAVITVAAPAPANACGCLSPPVPPPGVTEYAVNQQAEQIIFEKPDMNTVRAHVLIRYAGDPESFAWLVPVPSVPELALSEDLLFGYLDEATRPRVNIFDRSICPDQEYRCKYRHKPDCNPQRTDVVDAATVQDTGSWGADAFSDAANGPDTPPGIDVIGSQIVGEYQTVVFRADESHLAVQWLNDNGFIVNDSMAPYMQPYVDEGMVFVAAKLVPGAGIDAIRPLSITYDGQHPMIPLRLTAVAAEPHLTVTAWFFGDAPYAPIDQPLIGVPEAALGRDDDGRVNYPMVLSRIVDEAGGDAYVLEDEGNVSSLVAGLTNASSPCCDPEIDTCNVAADGQCQCPGASYDESDCSEVSGLLSAVGTLEDIASRHSQYTRLTTRLSAHEMTFDPRFDARAQALPPLPPRSSSQLSLTSCAGDIIDQALYDDVLSLDPCTSVYCGAGECVVSATGTPGCACDEGFTARTFTDLDGAPSVTCVEQTNTVDFGQAVDVPDACAEIDCGAGTCVDVGGFPTCRCNAGAGAIVDATGEMPSCVTNVTARTGDAGARDYTDALRDVAVCAPRPPRCGEDGWLVPIEERLIDIKGEECAGSVPDPEDLEPLPDYFCVDYQLVPGEELGVAAGEVPTEEMIDDYLDEEDTSPGGGDVSNGVVRSGGTEAQGCSCRVTAKPPTGSSVPRHACWLLLAGAIGLLLWRRRDAPRP